MRHTSTPPLVAAMLIASASSPECANAQSNPYALDRLFLESTHKIPFNETLSFNSVTAVENYFGLGSSQARLASEFFAGYTGDSANMLFARFVPGGGRARLFGGDISGITRQQLQGINGSLSFWSEGYKFNASVNLAGATNLASAASILQSQLNAAQPTVATTTGSSIAPGSASFTGSIAGGVMDVTAISSGSIAIGGVLTGDRYHGHVIGQISGTPGGVGLYNVWENRASVPPGTAVSETYGILTIGAVTSGAVGIGQEVKGSVAPNTAIQAKISGSGSGSKWVVDLTQTVASSVMTIKAAPLQVTNNHVTGATTSTDNLWINVNGQYPVLPSTVTYASGEPVATELGLTQLAGAYVSTPGEIVRSPYAWMTNIVNVVRSENEGFATFQMVHDSRHPMSPHVQAALERWADSSGGLYEDLESWSHTTPPIVDSIPSAEQLFARPGVAVPEPSTWAMILLGFAGLGFARYRLWPLTRLSGLWFGSVAAGDHGIGSSRTFSRARQ